MDNDSIDTLEQCIGELTELIVDAGSGHIKHTNVGHPYAGGNRLEVGGKGGKWYDLECRRQKDKFTN